MNASVQEMLQLARVFARMMLLSLIAVLFLGFFVVTSNPSIKLPSGKAAHIPTNVFQNLISFELPQYESEAFSMDKNKLFNFFLTVLVDVDFSNKSTLVAAGMPGMRAGTSTLLHPGSDVGENQAGIDFPTDLDGPVGMPQDEMIPDEVEITPSQQQDQEGEGGQQSHDPPAKPEEKAPVESKPRVLIYHSHNRESWLPELPNVKKESLAFDKTKNVTLLGQRLAKQLNAAGIQSMHDATDYQTKFKDTYKGGKSYTYSRETVKEALAFNPEITYIFDIHRDSGPRKATTVTIDGKDYAQLFIIIGAENPNWRENTKFAKQLVDQLDQQYPGMSKGIFAKDHSQGDGTYNQDLAAGSILIEVGGVNNTLQESYRTIDVLSEVIAQIIQNA